MTKWPKDNNSDLIQFYSLPDGSARWEVINLVYIQPPWRMYLAGTDTVVEHGIRVHKLAADSLSRILDAIWVQYGRSQDAIAKAGLDQFGGSYQYRPRRGSSRLSLHAFGAAIDLDPQHNRMHRGNRGVMQAKVIACFEAEGWRWGGDYGDPMHFEAVYNDKPQPIFNTGKDPYTQQTIVEDCVSLIKRWESFRATPYDDRGSLAIGYGHTSKLGTLAVTEDLVLTEQQANDLLRKDLGHLSSLVDPLIVRQLTDNQYGAVLSFCYNLGVPNFKSSTLLRLLNLGEFEKAAEEFGRWVKSTNPVTKQKETLAGLVKRRAAERELFERK